MMLPTNKIVITAIIAMLVFLSGCSLTKEESSEAQSGEDARLTTLKKSQQKAIAESTVLIKREFQYGSGTIIAQVKTRNKNYAYYVLTARHSVDKTERSQIKILDGDRSFTDSCEKSDRATACNSLVYSIYTNDGKRHPIDYLNIMKYAKDFALVRFESKNHYSVASLASKRKIERDSPAYVAGYRGCDRPELDMKDKYELTSGKVTKSNQRSGNLRYTNFTIGGMSGGGVFNQQGKLIAIHQRADRKKQYNPQDCLSLESYAGDLGNNHGTTVDKFLEQKGISLEVKRNYRECRGMFGNSQCSVN